MPYDFELAITGLCYFDFTGDKVELLLVNSIDNQRFIDDPDLKGFPRFKAPVKHFPRLTFQTDQQRQEGMPERTADQVFVDPAGVEYSQCFLEGEHITLDLNGSPDVPLIRNNGRGTETDPTHSSPAFLDWFPAIAEPLKIIDPAVSLKLHDECSLPLPNPRVITRVTIKSGLLQTERINLHLEKYASWGWESIRDFNAPTDPGPRDMRSMADVTVLRLFQLDKSIMLSSDKKPSVQLGPGGSEKIVRAIISNYHSEPHEKEAFAYDFLWYFELFDFSKLPPLPPPPTRADLPIPVLVVEGGGVTGSSALCPPITR